MRQVAPLIVAVCCVFASCGSTDTKTTERVAAVRAQIAAGNQPSFNPAMITKEEKERVRVDANQFVSEVNRTIQRRDYTAWLRYLEPKYRAKLESPDNLARASQSDRLKQRKIVLQNLLDYFVNVVVPARSELRVDDIEFVSENKVKAFMLRDGQRLLIYELERYGDSWRVVN